MSKTKGELIEEVKQKVRELEEILKEARNSGISFEIIQVVPLKFKVLLTERIIISE